MYLTTDNYLKRNQSLSGPLGLCILGCKKKREAARELEASKSKAAAETQVKTTQSAVVNKIIQQSSTNEQAAKQTVETNYTRTALLATGALLVIGGIIYVVKKSKSKSKQS